ncbi:hypothetical protein C8J57DRAFT_1509721 [Mycena rebaudengoi]|nr:hypothetical protein C8J57DRAFT_1509721 [Mycena rebaudengoi]
MSFANHGKCLNDEPPVARPELAKCVVCVLGCYAAQHMDMNGAQAPPPAPPGPAPSSPPSAT